MYGPGASSVVATAAAVVGDDPTARAAVVAGVVVAGSRAVVAGSPYRPATVVGATVVGSAATLTVMRVLGVMAAAAVAVGAAFAVDDGVPASMVVAEGPVAGFEGDPLEPHAISTIAPVTHAATTRPKRTITPARYPPPPPRVARAAATAHVLGSEEPM